MKKRIFIVSITIVLIVCLFIIIPKPISVHISSSSHLATTEKEWSIIFSEEMNPETFTTESVTIKNKTEQIPLSWEWNKNNTVLILSPNEAYTIDDSYRIYISKGVKSANGKKLRNSFTYHFTAIDELPKIKDNDQLKSLLAERRQKNNQETVVKESLSTDDRAMEKSEADTSGTTGPASTTNVQVDDIDEGDIIKTDGKFIYYVRDTDLVITQADKENSKVVSTISEKEFYPRDMHLHGNILVTIGESFKMIREDTQSKTDKEIAMYPYFNSQTTVHLYDVTDLSNPVKVREVSIEGYYMASRKMDGFLYLVANNYPPYAMEKESELDIRPYYKDTAIQQESQPIEDIYFFPDSSEDALLLLASLNLSDLDQEVFIESYLGASNQFYMSKNHMYVAVHQFEKHQSIAEDTSRIMLTMPAANTEIFQFTVEDGKVIFNASTVVNGTLINQFAMDERNGTFRVATTKGDMWRNDEPSTNNLYIFDDQLKRLGAVEGLAEGERIYSVRFMEDMAYMVTFKQVDPLFVIDLKDPKHPAVLGELKIPGFSNYLHPLDDNHLIGFGQHTTVMPIKSNNEPVVRLDGLKISVFDVTDPLQPKEKFSEIIGQGGSYSEINYNHKVLYKHPEKNIFGFPAMLFESKMVTKGGATYEEQRFIYEGAFLYDISAETGIELVDTITHQKEGILEYPEWETQIRRMVSVGDFLYTVSNEKITVYDMTHKNIVHTVELPKMPYIKY